MRIEVGWRQIIVTMTTETKEHLEELWVKKIEPRSSLDITYV